MVGRFTGKTINKMSDERTEFSFLLTNEHIKILCSGTDSDTTSRRCGKIRVHLRRKHLLSVPRCI